MRDASSGDPVPDFDLSVHPHDGFFKAEEWLKKARSWKLRDLLAALRRKLQGYWNYYGVLGNSMMTARYQRAVYGLLYKWLNRRSQRRSVTWSSYAQRWRRWRLPGPRVVEAPPPGVLQGRRKPA